VRVLGCPVDPLTMAETLDRCAEIIDAGRPTQQVSVNAAKLVAARDDPELRRIIEQCEPINADGQSVVWASRLLGAPLPERVAGIDLMFELFGLAERRGLGVYILGARAEVLERAVCRLQRRYPALDLRGWHHGYFAERESEAVVRRIRDVEPHILLVAMTSPRKEYWLSDHGAATGAPLLVGVGGSIDVVAGVARRAPRWMQRAGLEWAYRVAQEPRRLGKRYAVTNARFLGLLAAQLAGKAIDGRSAGVRHLRRH
jgi:N-acetylglucosaminyldiphosphoundecaprenol N-acetyl-beta-D-mannosaminyltransferase